MRCGVCTASVALALASCSHPKTSLPALPDATVNQRAMWEVAPDDTLGGFVVADLGHELERLRALKVVLDTGPLTRTYVQKGMAQAMLALGFDPLDPEGWKKAGFDPNGPMGVFLGDQDRVGFVFHATDGKAAQGTITTWTSKNATPPTLDCAALGALYRCGSKEWKPAADAQHSMWPQIESNVSQGARSLGVLGYMPLDRGPIGKQVATAPVDAPYAGAHAAWMGSSMSNERYVLRMGMRGDSMVKLAPYLEPKPNSSLLGMADGSIAAMRMTFSPDKVWSFMKTQLGAQYTQTLAMAQAGTGIDFDKELAGNLTGQVLLLSYRGDLAGPDGKHRALQDRLSNVFLVGTVDDAITRHFTQRLGEVLGGMIGSLPQSPTMKVSYRSDVGDRVVHWFTIELSGEDAALVSGGKAAMWLTSFPGGMAMGEGEEGLAQLRKHIGRKESAFLQGLPLPEDRDIFAHSGYAGWGRTGDAFAQRMDQIPTTAQFMKTLGPDASKLMSEGMQIGQLLFDSANAVSVSGDRVELFGQLTYDPDPTGAFRAAWDKRRAGDEAGYRAALAQLSKKKTWAGQRAALDLEVADDKQVETTFSKLMRKAAEMMGPGGLAGGALKNFGNSP